MMVLPRLNKCTSANHDALKGSFDWQPQLDGLTHAVRFEL